MGRSIIYVSPVGTGILENFSRWGGASGLVEKYGIDEWGRLGLDDPRNLHPDGQICSVVRGHEVYEALLSYVLRDPRRASPEINGVQAIRSLYRHRARDVMVMLYTTNTCNAMLCGRLVEEALRGQGFSVQRVVVRGIGGLDQFEEGLVDILDKVVSKVVEWRRRGLRVYINATPGFKAETTFLVISALLAGADGIVYIHQAFKEPVQLPAPPIMLDTGIIKPLLEYMGEAYRVPAHLLHAELGVEEAKRLEDMGILQLKGGAYTLRPWVKKLVEILKPNHTP